MFKIGDRVCIDCPGHPKHNEKAIIAYLDVSHEPVWSRRNNACFVVRFDDGKNSLFHFTYLKLEKRKISMSNIEVYDNV